MDKTRKIVREELNKIKNFDKFLNENVDHSDGIDIAFRLNPNFNKIGDKHQYNEYLNTIFPNSKYKKIVYHATKTENIRRIILISGFDFNMIKNELRGKGLSISTNIEFTKGFGNFPIPLIINVNTMKSNLQIQQENLKEEDYDLITDYSYGLIQAGTITNNKLIHILGSKKDEEMFISYML